MEQVRATRDTATLRADRAYRIDSSPAFVVAAHRCLPSSNASFPREAAGILRFRLDERAPLPSTDRVRPSPQTDLATPAEPVRAEATQATTPPPPPYESVVLEEPPPADDAKIPDDPKRDRRAHAFPLGPSLPLALAALPPRPDRSTRHLPAPMRTPPLAAPAPPATATAACPTHP